MPNKGTSKPSFLRRLFGALFFWLKWFKPNTAPGLPSDSNSEESFAERLEAGSSRTRTTLFGSLINALSGGGKIDADLLEELETTLLMADVGISTTEKIVGRLRERLKRKELKNADALWDALRKELSTILEPYAAPLVIDTSKKPYVILVVGVNGVGKTTTIGKLARRFQNNGQSVMLAAGDTFRAAAVEQLKTWGTRNNIPVVSQQAGADSAAVIHDALESAQSRDIDIVIADTAGRLHTADNLMAELSKINRVIQRFDASAPHETLLVLDAGTGQNALNQAEQFNKTTQLTGIVMTKLDGTAKGGIAFALANQVKVPIRLIGVGEGINDLGDFNAAEFINSLLGHGAISERLNATEAEAE